MIKKTGQVWSNKTGTDQFCDVLTAAYALEAQYTEGAAAAEVDKELVCAVWYHGWLNHLFQASYPVGYPDLWDLFEAMKEDDEYDSWGGPEIQDWDELADPGSGWRDLTQISAALTGTDWALREAEELPCVAKMDGSADITFPELLRRLRGRSSTRKGDVTMTALRGCCRYTGTSYLPGFALTKGGRL